MIIIQCFSKTGNRQPSPLSYGNKREKVSAAVTSVKTEMKAVRNLNTSAHIERAVQTHSTNLHNLIWIVYKVSVQFVLHKCLYRKENCVRWPLLRSEESVTHRFIMCAREQIVQWTQQYSHLLKSLSLVGVFQLPERKIICTFEGSL